MKREVGEEKRSCYLFAEVKGSVMERYAEWWRSGRTKQFQFLQLTGCHDKAWPGVVCSSGPKSPNWGPVKTVSPHGVQQSPVVFQPQELVWRGHVVRNGFLPVEEEGVWGPDVTGQQVIQGKHLHRALKAKTLVLPALAEEHVNSVFLQNRLLNQDKLARQPQL